MSTTPHGPQFDEFRSAPSQPHGAQTDQSFRDPRGPGHGGTRQDEGFADRGVQVTSHGALWDEWQAMPFSHPHGQLFDSDFHAPADVKDAGHGGTWFDVFRGGRTEVQAIIGGLPVEGVVLRVHADHAVIRLRNSREHEVNLEQIQSFRQMRTGRWDVKPSATTGDRGRVTDADYQTAQARDVDAAQVLANGGQLRKALDDLDDVLKRPHSYPAVGKPCAGCGKPIGKTRSASVVHTSAGKQGSIKHFCGVDCAMDHANDDAAKVYDHEGELVAKADGDDLDVLKGSPRLAYGVHQGSGKMESKIGPYCGPCARKTAPALTNSIVKVHETRAPATGRCINCQTPVRSKAVAKDVADALDVLKSVDATETALQAQGDSGGTVGHRKACPRGGSAPCGAARGGKCSACGAQVEDHRAVGKTLDELDVLKTIPGVS